MLAVRIRAPFGSIAMVKGVASDPTFTDDAPLGPGTFMRGTSKNGLDFRAAWGVGGDRQEGGVRLEMNRAAPSEVPKWRPVRQTYTTQGYLRFQLAHPDGRRDELRAARLLVLLRDRSPADIARRAAGSWDADHQTRQGPGLPWCRDRGKVSGLGKAEHGRKHGAEASAGSTLKRKAEQLASARAKRRRS